ncbi:MAG: threonine synthase [Acidobacteria bacterium]|nr:threonine synthase [Acidobacteriota bacterium]
MARFELVCSECGMVFSEDPDLLVCPKCSVRQEAGASLRGVLEVRLSDPLSRWPDGAVHEPGVLTRLLPLADPRVLAPLAVGGTPLLEAPRLRQELGMPKLWLKDDIRNPSGSTKDRASWLVAAKAREYGREVIATASTGNAASSLAAVCAASGQRAVVLVPATAPRAKLVQMMVCGARVIPVDGSYDDAFELCCEACRELGWYNRNTALNPYTIEGKKTLAVEIARGLAPEAPDVVIVPAGDGVITAGVAKGFADLVEWGLLQRAPRLVIVQPTGASALVDALERGADDVTAVRGAASVADSLVVESPRNARLALARVRASDGGGVAVSDDAILGAVARLARLTGVFAEPAAAASLAGLKAALDAGLVGRDERAVLLATGSGLKDLDAASRTVDFPQPVPPDLESVARVVEG